MNGETRNIDELLTSIRSLFESERYRANSWRSTALDARTRMLQLEEQVSHLQQALAKRQGWSGEQGPLAVWVLGEDDWWEAALADERAQMTDDELEADRNGEY